MANFSYEQNIQANLLLVDTKVSHSSFHEGSFVVLIHAHDNPVLE